MTQKSPAIPPDEEPKGSLKEIRGAAIEGVTIRVEKGQLFLFDAIAEDRRVTGAIRMHARYGGGFLEKEFRGELWTDIPNAGEWKIALTYIPDASSAFQALFPNVVATLSKEGNDATLHAIETDIMKLTEGKRLPKEFQPRLMGEVLVNLVDH